MQKNMNSLLEKDETFLPAFEVLPFKRPENNLFLSGAIHCEHSIWNIQIFASNLHELNICEASEIIKLQKNGGSGGIHTQIPNWPIYIGIAA